jgi:hypothetical protein
MRFNFGGFITGQLLVLSLIFTGIIGCQSEPKVIEAETLPQGDQDIRSRTEGDMHEVEVLDLLHTDKYTYLDVQEDDRRYWVAVSKMAAEKGDKYMYRGGLLKKNFYSREFDRNFETIYLVSRLTPMNGANGASALDRAKASLDQPSQGGPIDIVQPDGAVSLSDLFEDPGSYTGKSIMVKGKCVKVNNRIMDRNWVHIQDGSSINGESLDLTITTQENVPVGAVAIFKGVIATQKDFGAGYRYEILLEDAVIVQE